MRLCVFCGSHAGDDRVYVQAACEMGQTLASLGIGLVYGGGRAGMMGALAEAALLGGGVVIGVIPRALAAREIQHTGLTELHTVASMHERKTKMEELSDGFIALPGGAGTLEEILEQWTWAQLGIHTKPCGFLNTNGYFDSLREMIARMTRDGFLKKGYAEMLAFETEPLAIVEKFREYAPPPPKWLMP